MPMQNQRTWQGLLWEEATSFVWKAPYHATNDGDIFKFVFSHQALKVQPSVFFIDICWDLCRLSRHARSLPFKLDWNRPRLNLAADNLFSLTFVRIFVGQADMPGLCRSNLTGIGLASTLQPSVFFIDNCWDLCRLRRHARPLPFKLNWNRQGISPQPCSWKSRDQE
jgi:hypothetical protein